ncbi:hypothetical protein J6TS1_19440 [Siminovitchia terrae]|uniref:Uncharacterized protein n=1 Tax=Siminovitchia terrae TaxID=1914933 RepID=A0ABQ4KWM3_SIMTE|nr:hypothetical protein J22TS1_42740 [Siminovitchia terrae]GIN96074.1 hypothetical protein J6TS1_19440 [Siminovitchia terrae]
MGVKILYSYCHFTLGAFIYAKEVILTEELPIIIDITLILLTLPTAVL